MYCPACGAQNNDNATTCLHCGQTLSPSSPAAPPPFPPSGQTGGGYRPGQPLPAVSNHLVWSILVTIFCCLPFGIVAIVYSSKVNGKLEMGDYEGALSASNKARTWIIVSAVSIVLWAVIAVIAAIAIPQFMMYRTKAYDAAARANLEALATAQEGYFLENGTYADDPDDLASSFVPEADVYIRIVRADQNGWKGIAQHAQSRNQLIYDSEAGGMQY